VTSSVKKRPSVTIAHVRRTTPEEAIPSPTAMLGQPPPEHPQAMSRSAERQNEADDE